MSTRTEITPAARSFLEKAYLLKPQTAFNLSSLAVSEENIDEHEAFDFEHFRRLAKLGYVIGMEDRTWEIGGRQVDVVIFQLTPLGLAEAENSLRSRRDFTMADRFAAISRSDWIALVALIVAVIALFQGVA